MVKSNCRPSEGGIFRKKVMQVDAWKILRFDTLDSTNTEAKRRARIVLFMETSVANPLFNDPDTETTMAFINAGGEITPFCLNTDWQKAFLAAEERLKEER